MHDQTRSENLPKLSRSRGFKHMERFVFALRAKIPSRATPSDSANAASAFRQRSALHSDADYVGDSQRYFLCTFFFNLTFSTAFFLRLF